MASHHIEGDLLTRFGTREYPDRGVKPGPSEPKFEANAEIPAAFPAEEKARKKAAVNATKAALDLAAEEGIDLSKVKGSGAEGRITLNDVRKAVKEK